MLGLTAEQIGTVILGLSMGIIAIMGGQKGKQMAKGHQQTPSETLEIAGAIVSDKAVDRMVQSLDGFTAAATLMTRAIEKDVEAKGKLTAALNRNSDAAEEVQEEIKDTAARIDQLKTELIRNGPR